MKNAALLALGLALSTPLTTHAGDCMEIALQLKIDLEESLKAIQSQPGYIDRINQNMGYPEHSHTYAMSSEIHRLGLLVELYQNAFDEECVGQVKDMHDTLVKRAKRKARGKKAFDAPSCDALMERIEKGRAGEFCPKGKTHEFDVDAIRKTIELENRKKK